MEYFFVLWYWNYQETLSLDSHPLVDIKQFTQETQCLIQIKLGVYSMLTHTAQPRSLSFGIGIVNLYLELCLTHHHFSLLIIVCLMMSCNGTLLQILFSVCVVRSINDFKCQWIDSTSKLKSERSKQVSFVDLYSIYPCCTIICYFPTVYWIGVIFDVSGGCNKCYFNKWSAPLIPDWSYAIKILLSLSVLLLNLFSAWHQLGTSIPCCRDNLQLHNHAHEDAFTS